MFGASVGVSDHSYGTAIWDQDEVDDLLDDVEFTLRSYETPI